MRKRNIKKQIWIDVQEDNLLKKKSKESGLSESEFIRSLVKGYRVKAQPTEEIKTFQRELYGIANNINHPAHYSHFFDGPINITACLLVLHGFPHQPDFGKGMLILLAVLL